MNITLKLYAALGEFLPAEAQANAVKVDVPDDATISDVLTSHQVPLGRCHLIMINGHQHDRNALSSTKLAGGDTLAVLPPAG